MGHASSNNTRDAFSYDNYEFYLEFTVGYQSNKRPRNIVFTSSESNAPTEALSKMSDEFTITAGGTAPPFQKIGADSNSGGTYFIQFTLAPNIRGLEDVYSIGQDHIYLSRSSNGGKQLEFDGRVGIGTDSPGDQLDVNGAIRGHRFYENGNNIGTDAALRTVMELSSGDVGLIFLQSYAAGYYGL